MWKPAFVPLSYVSLVNLAFFSLKGALQDRRQCRHLGALLRRHAPPSAGGRRPWPSRLEPQRGRPVAVLPDPLSLRRCATLLGQCRGDVSGERGEGERGGKGGRRKGRARCTGARRPASLLGKVRHFPPRSQRHLWRRRGKRRKGEFFTSASKKRNSSCYLWVGMYVLSLFVL